MEEYIEINQKDGSVKKVKVLFRFHEEQSTDFYIVYEFNNEQFAAKYNDVVGVSKLDTNLTEKELEKLERIFNELKGDKI